MKTFFLLLISALMLQSCGRSQARHAIQYVTVAEKSDSVSAFLDTVFKYPVISDDSLLTLVQQRTFRYFWDYAHPVSGLARERLGSEELVTIGGSGFGIMSIPIAVERGFVSREEGAARLYKIISFLLLQADRFHGAYPHWMDGTTGRTIPFSTYDNGGDIVETALLIQGLLTVKQYFNTSDPVEIIIRDGIDQIWEGVEWDWYLNGQNALYWHWSPDFAWNMDMQVNGWNEALIAYVLAASSPTHPIPKAAYEDGWAQNGKCATENVTIIYCFL